MPTALFTDFENVTLLLKDGEQAVNVREVRENRLYDFAKTQLVYALDSAKPPGGRRCRQQRSELDEGRAAGRRGFS